MANCPARPCTTLEAFEPFLRKSFNWNLPFALVTVPAAPAAGRVEAPYFTCMGVAALPTTPPQLMP